MKRSTINRNGMTLIELLVVATIILMVTAISVPILKPMMQSQATNNAAAVVSTYLNRARARAIQTGRPCGVTFEVWDGTDTDINTGASIPGACLVLRQVEVPPAYTGMTGTETVTTVDPNRLTPVPQTNDNETWYRIWPYENNPNGLTPYWDTFVKNETSARIQFDNMGPFYELDCSGRRASLSVPMVKEIPGIQFPSKQNVPFKVLRDPKPTMTAPVGLPQGTVVDLACSGTDKNPVLPSTNVTIMFLPNGSVDSITGLDDLENDLPGDTIYFMIGHWERIPALGIPEDALFNYQDGSNFWVTINPQNGTVSTVELNTAIDPNSSDTVLYQSRNFARQSQRNIGAY